jgi:hypothetical protein
VRAKPIKSKIVIERALAVANESLHPVTGTVLFLLLLHNFPPSRGGSFLAGARLGVILGTSLNAPVKDIVILVSFTDEKVPEELAKVGIVGLVVEAKCTGVVQEDTELVREAAAKQVGWCRHLLFHDAIILLFLGGGLEALPGKSPTEEVHEDVGKRFKIVSAGLFNTEMGVDGSVASCASQVLVLSVGDVEVGLGIPKLFG